MKIINPATELIIKELDIDDEASVKKKLDKLKTGQKRWASTPVKERLDCIIKFGELVKANVNELAEILTSETGKPFQQSLNEINGAQNRVDHLKSNAEKWLKRSRCSSFMMTQGSCWAQEEGALITITTRNRRDPCYPSSGGSWMVYNTTPTPSTSS